MTNENGRKTKRLSREILGLLLITAVIALFFWGFLYLTANSISETYFAERNLQPSEGQWLTLRAWIRSVSLLSTVILFLVLFLFLLPIDWILCRWIFHQLCRRWLGTSEV